MVASCYVAVHPLYIFISSGANMFCVDSSESSLLHLGLFKCIIYMIHNIIYIHLYIYVACLSCIYIFELFISTQYIYIYIMRALLFTLQFTLTSFYFCLYILSICSFYPPPIKANECPSSRRGL